MFVLSIFGHCQEDKRLRREGEKCGSIAGDMLEAKSLRKALIPSSLLSTPSPGSLQSTRLAIYVNDDDSCCSVFIASGCDVYYIELSLVESMITKGKDNLLVPIHAQILNSSMVERCPHCSEIQSIVLSEGDGEDSLVMGTVDSYGHLIVSRLDRNISDVHKISYSILPRDSGVGEGSWAGLCFCPVNQSMLSIWDLRSFENGGCVHRVRGSIGDLIYTICSSPAGEIAFGGSDRTVSIYDSRRWSAVSRWVNCCKYEITGLCFSSVDPLYMYIQSLDYEVLCGQWKECMKEFSFRGDSNWLGFGKCANKDVLAGWCDSGSIFVADVNSI